MASDAPGLAEFAVVVTIGVLFLTGIEVVEFLVAPIVVLADTIIAIVGVMITAPVELIETGATASNEALKPLAPFEWVIFGILGAFGLWYTSLFLEGFVETVEPHGYVSSIQAIHLVEKEVAVEDDGDETTDPVDRAVEAYVEADHAIVADPERHLERAVAAGLAESGYPEDVDVEADEGAEAAAELEQLAEREVEP